VKKNKVPGPGHYPVLQAISKDGNYYYSKFRGSKAQKISPAKKPRFTYGNSKQALYHKGICLSTVDDGPGPGTYSQKGISMNNTGNYFSTKYRSNKAMGFARSTRIPMGSGSYVPGPG